KCDMRKDDAPIDRDRQRCGWNRHGAGQWLRPSGRDSERGIYLCRQGCRTRYVRHRRADAAEKYRWHVSNLHRAERHGQGGYDGPGGHHGYLPISCSEVWKKRGVCGRLFFFADAELCVAQGIGIAGKLLRTKAAALSASSLCVCVVGCSVSQNTKASAFVHSARAGHV